MAIDREVVQERLLLMRRLLEDLRDAGPVTAERLESERLTRHAVERIVTQLVDLAVSINSHVVAGSGDAVPGTYRESFAAAARCGVMSADLAESLAPSAGLRNVLIHEYVAVDVHKVAAATPLVDEGFGRYVSQVASYLLETQD